LQQTRSYQRLGAWAVLLLFTAFWSSKTVHVLLAHHHDHEAEHLVCDAAHDPNVAHIHDDRWATEDCSICAFVVSVPEPFSLLSLPKFFPKLPNSASPVFYHTPVCDKQVCDPAMRRGPPVG